MFTLPWHLFLALLGLVFALLCHDINARTSNSTSLSFQVSSGGNDNYFLRDNVTSAQLLLTSANNTSPLRRLVFALPAGNSGGLVYFLPLPDNSTTGDVTINGNSTLGISVVNGTFTSTTDKFNNSGAQVELAFSGNATLGVTIIGAVRAMRDYVEGAGTMHEIFNYTLTSFNATFVRLHHQYINSTGNGSTIFKGADLYLSTTDNSTRISVTPGNNGTFAPPTINILVPSGEHAKGTILARVLTNETSLTGLNTESLFLVSANGSNGLSTALGGLANGTDVTADQVSFLSYSNKFTAGGWRFLTYFGRDSMIALRLLMPTLTSDAIEAALGAVIERANSTGALCHEETIGDYASFINLQNNQSYLGNQPFYDYKMIDTDLYLLPAMSHYFLDLPQGKNRASQFFARKATLQNGTYAEILNRTINYNLGRALPFFVDQTFSNLLAFRPGQPVGNWRDSNEGTGYGPIPFDVNAALVPANLRATAALANAGIIAQPAISLGNNSRNGTTAGNVTPPSQTVTIDDIAALWETAAPSFFDVAVDGATAESRLKNFVVQANLSQVLLNSPEGNSTEQGNLTATNVSLYALSLMADGTPVQVMNSDMSFNLMYGTNPYPRGLLTDIGMVVANPAYDSNTTNIEVLGRASYQGTVIWSFQQGLMAGGLARQLGFCSKNISNRTVDTNPPPKKTPEWCSDKTFVKDLTDAQSRLWTSILGAKENLNTEVWSYSYDNATNSFSPADLAVLSPVGTEADVVQLWSFGFLALLDPFLEGSATTDEGERNRRVSRGGVEG